MATTWRTEVTYRRPDGTTGTEVIAHPDGTSLIQTGTDTERYMTEHHPEAHAIRTYTRAI